MPLDSTPSGLRFSSQLTQLKRSVRKDLKLLLKFRSFYNCFKTRRQHSRDIFVNRLQLIDGRKYRSRKSKFFQIFVFIFAEEAEDLNDPSPGESEEEKQITGKIVGIIHRKWKQYCGILQLSPVPGVIIY